MERGSTQHGPRMDDELEHETRSIVQGAPVESHVEEWREQEGPGDGEPVPDARIEGDRPSASAMLSADEVEARSELARHLEPGRFPATRDEVIEMARELHSPDELIEQLERLPEGRYETFGEVWESLGGRREPSRTAVHDPAPASGPEPVPARGRTPTRVDLVALPLAIVVRASDLGIKAARGIVDRVRNVVSR